METPRAFGVKLQNYQDHSSAPSLEVMRSLAGRLEVVGGLDPFAQFDQKALTIEVLHLDY